MKNIKQTDLYSNIRRLYKEYVQRESISNIHINQPGINEISQIVRDYVSGVKKYLDILTQENRYGFFAEDSRDETIYAYVYYVMTAHLIEYDLSADIKDKIIAIFMNCQKEDGLCYDSQMFNYTYLIGDGWGARHFIPHYFIAMSHLNIVPKYEFRYLESFMEDEVIYSFLDNLDWSHPWGSSNVLMNLAVALQYERDERGNSKAAQAVRLVQKWLLDNIREDCGMWYQGKIDSKAKKLEIIRGAYHMFPILIYDGIDFPYKEKAIDIILEVQNKYGGFDLRRNSSACEDIDAIEPIIRLSKLIPEYRKQEIQKCICKALGWVIQNQMEDGGCVFRLGEKFDYGHYNLASGVNKSNQFGTWFRTLSVCYMYNFLMEKEVFKLIKMPGYEYPL